MSLFFAFAISLNASVLVLHDTNKSIPLNSCLEVAHTDKKTVSALGDADFSALDMRNLPKFKATKSLWLRCTLKNQSSRTHFMLYDTFRWTPRMTLFVQDEHNRTRHYLSGEAVLMHAKAFKSADVAFPITLAPFSTTKLFFHIDAIDYVPKISIMSTLVFATMQQHNAFLQGLLVGVIGALILYNLILALNLRSFLYASYVGYMLFMLLFITADNGVLLTYVDGKFAHILVRAKLIFVAVAVGWLFIFSGRFLQISSMYKRFYKYMLVYAMLLIAFGVYNYYAYTFIAFTLFNVLLIGSIAVLIVAIVLAYIKAVKVTQIFALGYGLFLLLALLTLLNNMHIIDFEFGPKWAVAVGVALEGIIFSYALYLRLQLSQKERAQFEQEAKRKDDMLQMQSRMASIGEMTANIIHQSKQPLSTIASTVSSMHISAKLDTLDSHTIDECVQSVNEQITLMQSTSRDFLNYYRPDKERKNFSLNQAVKQAVKFTQNSMKMRRIDIQVKSSEEIIINGFANELNQVIINLLNNAKDAHISNNTQNAQVVVSILKKDNQAVLTVEDNAGGVDVAIIDRLFDAFVTTKQDVGTGIGLHMCKQIITQSMHGTIDAHNTSKGACFTIRLPLAH